MIGAASVREEFDRSGATDVLLGELALLKDDPVRFVASMFPWEAPGGELEHFKGPELWQLRVLAHIRDRLAAGASVNEAIQIACASGHGVGKSTLVAGSFYGPWQLLRIRVELSRPTPKPNSKPRLGLSWGSGTDCSWAAICLNLPRPPSFPWTPAESEPGEWIWCLGASATRRPLRVCITKAVA